jgi:post-segregation antitoxin (ccd killing protein)
MTSLLATNPDAQLPMVRSGVNLKLKEEDRHYWETWGERNKLAIDEYNERVRTHGVWGAQYRAFARNLD